MSHPRLFVLTAFPIAAAAVAALFLFRRRVTPEERERRRRCSVNSVGRMVDAMVMDVNDAIVQYSYEVGGVTYTAAQDLAGVCMVPENPAAILGVATVKYAPRDPANSIVVCESWSGLRRGPRVPLTEHTQKGNEE